MRFPEMAHKLVLSGKAILAAVLTRADRARESGYWLMFYNVMTLQVGSSSGREAAAPLWTFPWLFMPTHVFAGRNISSYNKSISIQYVRVLRFTFHSFVAIRAL